MTMQEKHSSRVLYCNVTTVDKAFNKELFRPFSEIHCRAFTRL